MFNKLRTDLDQFHKKTAERPAFDFCGQGKASQKVAQIVRQNKQPQPHLIGDKMLARQPRPVQGVLALLDPLLSRASAVLKMHHSFGSGTHVGHHKTDPRKQLTLMPLQLGNHTAQKYPLPEPPNAQYHIL